MTEHAQIVRVTWFEPRDDERDLFLAKVHELARGASETPGCFGAQLCTVEGTPGTVAVVSRWQDRASLDMWWAESGDTLRDELAELLASPARSEHLLSMP